ncbi:PIN domain (DUF4935) [Flavobacteriaceae bacterium]
MKILFIDANIYLRFFDSNQKEFKKLLEELLKIKSNLFITNQIVNEIERNKLSVFEKSINNYKNKINIENVFLPEHFATESNSGYSAAKVATIPTQSTPAIPLQRSPRFRWKGGHLFRSKVRHFTPDLILLTD